MNHAQNKPQPIPLEQELAEQLDHFAWRIRSLVGGYLLAIVAQKPAWPSAALNRTLLNVLVLVADPQVPEAENLHQRYVLSEGHGWQFPVDFIGYQRFTELVTLGDPSSVFLCTDGHVVYDSEGAFRRLQGIVSDLDQPVANVERLQDYLAQKRDAHYENVGLLLTNLLNEIYMGTVAGLARELIGPETNVRVSLLRDLAQWDGIKQRLARERWEEEPGSGGEGGEIAPRHHLADRATKARRKRDEAAQLWSGHSGYLDAVSRHVNGRQRCAPHVESSPISVTRKEQ